MRAQADERPRTAAFALGDRVANAVNPKLEPKLRQPAANQLVSLPLEGREAGPGHTASGQRANHADRSEVISQAGGVGRRRRRPPFERYRLGSGCRVRIRGDELPARELVLFIDQGWAPRTWLPCLVPRS